MIIILIISSSNEATVSLCLRPSLRPLGRENSNSAGHQSVVRNNLDGHYYSIVYYIILYHIISHHIILYHSIAYYNIIIWHIIIIDSCLAVSLCLRVFASLCLFSHLPIIDVWVLLYHCVCPHIEASCTTTRMDITTITIIIVITIIIIIIIVLCVIA